MVEERRLKFLLAITTDLSCRGANMASLASESSRGPRLRLLRPDCRARRAFLPGVPSIVGRTKSELSIGVEGSCLTPRPETDSLSIIDTSSAWDTTD